MGSESFRVSWSCIIVVGNIYFKYGNVAYMESVTVYLSVTRCDTYLSVGKPNPLPLISHGSEMFKTVL